MGCPQITDTCYEAAPRPCPAKEAGKEGCDGSTEPSARAQAEGLAEVCTQEACAQACRRATPLDAEARYIHYEGRNKYADLPTQDHSRGRDVYGYAPNPDRILNGRFAWAWTLRTDPIRPTLTSGVSSPTASPL